MPEKENMAAELDHKFNIGSGIDDLKTGWWRTLYLKTGCTWLWLKKVIILYFGKA